MFKLENVLMIGKPVDLYTLLMNDCEIENGIRGFMNAIIISYGYEVAVAKIGKDNLVKHISYYDTRGYIR